MFLVRYDANIFCEHLYLVLKGLPIYNLLTLYNRLLLSTIVYYCLLFFTLLQFTLLLFTTVYSCLLLSPLFAYITRIRNFSCLQVIYTPNFALAWLITHFIILILFGSFHNLDSNHPQHSCARVIDKCCKVPPFLFSSVKNYLV